MTLALLYGLAGLATVLLLAATLSAAARLWLAGSARRQARAAARLRPEVAAILARDQDGTAGELLIELADRLRRAPRRALTEVVLGYLGTVRGPDRQPLLALLAYDGTVPRASRDVHRHSWVRRARAADILGRAGQPAAATDLAALLADPVAEVRTIAAAGLPTVLDGESANGWVATELLRSAGRDHQLPGGVVVDALLRLGPDIVPVLLTALGTESAQVGEIAAEALGRLGAVDAAVALAEATHDPDGAVLVRATAATALGRLGLPCAVGPLVAALEPEHPLPVRTAAAVALGDLGDPGAVRPLLDLLDGGHPLCGVAAAALARLGTPGLVALDAVRSGRPGAPAGRHAAAELAIRAVRHGQDRPAADRWTAQRVAASQLTGAGG